MDKEGQLHRNYLVGEAKKSHIEAIINPYLSIHSQLSLIYRWRKKLAVHPQHVPSMVLVEEYEGEATIRFELS